MVRRARLCLAARAAIAFGLVLTASSATALSPKQAKEWCSNEGLRVPPDQIIAGCSAIISASKDGTLRAGAYGNRGNVYLAQGNQDRALADYNDAIRIDPRLPHPHIGRGVVYLNMGNHAGALADLTEAIRREPRATSAYHHRGRTYRRMGDHARAIADFSETIRLDPANAAAYISRAYSHLGNGDADRALADFDALVRRDPGSADGYYHRGIVQFTRGDFKSAAEDFLRSNDLRDGAYSFLWRFLARAHQDQDGAAELSAAATKLKTKDWPYPVIEFYLGRRSPQEMHSGATTPGERCEASYYVAEWRLLRNDRAAALADLQAAIDTCPKDFVEYMGALAEKKRLSP
jgi:tetratricopeptide (TPR) repeat protein